MDLRIIILIGIVAAAGCGSGGQDPSKTADSNIPRPDGTDSVEPGVWSTEDSGGMEVHVYVPGTPGKLENKRALMVALHGCSQTHDELKEGGGWQGVADQYGMIVAIPSVPNGGAVLGCWDYYGANHTPATRHNDDLIALVVELTNRGDLNIDPRQVYLSGLSSGGGQTMVLGCLAPHVFAGIGISAGPTVGTASFQIGFVATDANTATALCRALAGARDSYLETQVTSIVYGDMDFVVAQGYSLLNASVMAELYGASQSPDTSDIAGRGFETTWHKGGAAVVQLISVPGLGHAWPAGGESSGGGAYIDHSSINYPSVLTRFLFDSNRRVN